MQRHAEGVARRPADATSAGAAGGRAASAAPRELGWMQCDACGEPLKIMGHCKYLCRACGFLRTCMDTV